MATVEQGEAVNSSYFYVKFDNLNVAAFREVSGIGSENDVVVHHQVNKEGKATYVKTAGKLSWQNLVLKKGIDTDTSLWKWRNEIIVKGVDGQRKNGEIFLVDVQGKQQTTWKIVNAWPCNYVVGTLVPDTSEMLLEEIHLAHEGLERVK
jgi:phage tail-like protein